MKYLRSQNSYLYNANSFKKTYCTYLFILYSAGVKAVSPKYEIRGVWLTTNWGLDWPKKVARTDRETTNRKRTYVICWIRYKE